MQDRANAFLRILGTLLLLGAALGAMFFGPIGMFACAILVPIWYFLIGHHFLAWLIDRVFRAGGMDVDFRPELQAKALRLMKEQKFDQAITACREWMRRDRDSSKPHIMISQILAENQNDLKSAIRELELSVARPFPAAEHVTLALRLAELYCRAGREQEIDPVFRRIRGLHSRSPEIQRLDFR